ncbi:MAG: aminoglycoside phosphotransferase family protein [Nitrospirae bacterium]|nr:aminoglycoside phosphotransferase family protein [Nitrospirota bacterium]
MPRGKILKDPLSAAEQFKTSGRVIDIREFGSGNINNTFLVTLEAVEEKQFILQRVNTHVFRQPELVMLNMRIAVEHMLRHLQSAPFIAGRRWEVPRVLLTQEGRDHWLAPDGSFWRAVSFIDSALTFDTVQNTEHAEEVGRTIGVFHSLLNDLPPDGLADTLKGFHITPLYLRHFDEVLAKYGAGKSPEVNYCLRFVSERSARAHVLENAKEQGRLRLRPIHGDPKVNNIMIDTSTCQAVGIVDLDTVKPGLIHYDIGDCLRSGCNPPGEETEQWETVRFDTDLCRDILRGYLSTAREFLTENDFDYLYESIRLLTFELGLRFFTDYLEGNVYFKVKNPEHNLLRALVQLKLTESIESRETAIHGIIKDLR